MSACSDTKKCGVGSASRIIVNKSLEVQCDQKRLCAPDDDSIKTNIPHTIDDLKMAITEYIRNVDRAILNSAFENTVRRVHECLETGGGHFEHYL
jgi:hypothetical protein